MKFRIIAIIGLLGIATFGGFYWIEKARVILPEMEDLGLVEPPVELRVVSKSKKEMKWEFYALPEVAARWFYSCDLADGVKDGKNLSHIADLGAIIENMLGKIRLNGGGLLMSGIPIYDGKLYGVDVRFEESQTKDSVVRVIIRIEYLNDI